MAEHRKLSGCRIGAPRPSRRLARARRQLPAPRALRLRPRTDPPGRRDLEIIKQSPGYDIDLLCRAGLVAPRRAPASSRWREISASRQWYRQAVETGGIELEEHACASLTAGLRAAAFGVPFQPCGGLHGSDLPELNGWKAIEDPYGSGAVGLCDSEHPPGLRRHPCQRSQTRRATCASTAPITGTAS